MFLQAKPIWIQGKGSEMNFFAVFTAKVLVSNYAQLHITGATFYRVFIDGKFLGFGPARTAEGYAREDVLSIEVGDGEKECEIRVEAAGYFCRSISTVRQPSFVMAEVRNVMDTVLACTGRDFIGFASPCRVRKAERYSMQRHFTEVWDYRASSATDDEAYRAETEVLPRPPVVIGRTAPYPYYEDIDAHAACVRGSLAFDEQLPYKEKAYSGPIDADWGCFPDGEVPSHPFAWVQQQKQTVLRREESLPLILNAGEYAVIDLERVEAGFIRHDMEAMEESDVVVAFSEYCEGDAFRFVPWMNAHNVIEYFLPAKRRGEEISFEPYALRFAMVCVKRGQIRLNGFGVKTYRMDLSQIKRPDYGDSVLNAIDRAAVRTLAHNAVDLYTDCPSRERGGWLCDAYFTAKAEYALTGKTPVEDAFLENYRLYQNRGEYPAGVLPMCYPSDADHAHNAAKDDPTNKFIPQWDMWYVLEVDEYVLLRGHQDMKDSFKDSVYGLVAFFRQYENESGLLERLPSWNFVEWSKANSWTQDVNYPTNFLYARLLECVWELYGDRQCLKRCAEVRRAAVEQSFNGQYFRDHAVRGGEGKLCMSEDSSEACQYYAALFAGIDLSEPRYAPLKEMILREFSIFRDETKLSIMRVNMFIGAYLRLLTLQKMEEYELLLQNIKEMFGQMAESTGTLWEYRTKNNSLDHGFASFALALIETASKQIHQKPFLRVLGSSGWLPTPDNDGSCYTVSDKLLVDLGWSAPVNMINHGIEPLNMRYVFFTHMHGDHYLGLAQLLFYWRIKRGTYTDLTLAGPKGSIRGCVKKAMEYLYYQADEAKEYKEPPKILELSPGDSLEAEGFRIEAGHAEHTGNSLCYKITHLKTGDILCLSGDTEYQEEFGSFFKNCNLLVYEASFGAGPLPSGKRPKHSSAQEAARTARECGAGRLLLTHGSPDSRERAVAEAQKNLDIPVGWAMPLKTYEF